MNHVENEQIIFYNILIFFISFKCIENHFK
jgi:hypothetical protein